VWSPGRTTHESDIDLSRGALIANALSGDEMSRPWLESVPQAVYGGGGTLRAVTGRRASGSLSPPTRSTIRSRTRASRRPPPTWCSSARPLSRPTSSAARSPATRSTGARRGHAGRAAWRVTRWERSCGGRDASAFIGLASPIAPLGATVRRVLASGRTSASWAPSGRCSIRSGFTRARLLLALPALTVSPADEKTGAGSGGWRSPRAGCRTG